MAAEPGGIAYFIAGSDDEIERLAPEWNELLERSDCNRAFSSPVWFRAACHVENFRPSVLVACEAGRTAAILPVAIRSGTDEAIFPSSMCNYNDLIAATGDHRAAECLFTFARQHPKPYRRLNLRWLRTGSNCVRAAAACVLTNGCFIKERDYSFIRLSTWREYLGCRSRNFRKEIARVLRKAAEAGLSVEELAPDELPPAQLPALFLRLHFSRFGGDSAFRESSPNFQFAHTALPDLFAERKLRVFVVRRGSSILGIDLSLMGARSLCTWNGGYPTEAEQWSPGKLLLVAGIHRALELGLEEYDLMRGMQDWKARWANETRSIGRLEVEVETGTRL